MSAHTKLTRGLALGASAIALAACGAVSQDQEEGGPAGTCANYPQRPITRIVPYAAGGGTDILARAVAKGLSDELGVQVNVVNRPAGSGVVGMTTLKNSKPDGYTIGSGTVHLTTYHRIGLGNVTINDLRPVAVVSTVPAAVTVSSGSQFDSLQELLSFAEANPGELNGSGTGMGGIWDLARAGMLVAAGLPPNAIRWVPSEGAAPTLQELVAGGVDASFASPQENAGMLEDGRVKALGVMADERQPGFENLPTLKEQGLDFSLGAWRGIAAPKETPDCVIDVLDEAVGNVVKGRDFKQFMKNSNLAITYRDAKDAAKFWKAQDKYFADLIPRVGLG